MKRSLVLTSIDEAMLSAISFGISLAFIRVGDKSDFGVYTLVMGIILLIRGVENAIVVTPLTTHGARLERNDRERFVGAVERLQTLLGLAGALLLAAGLLVRGGAGSVQLAGAAAFAAFGTWLREFQRSVWLLEERNGQALIGDAIYAALTMIGLAIVWIVERTVTTTTVLFVTGCGAFAPGVIGLARRGTGPHAPLRPTARVLYEQGRWTLPGTAVIWGQNSGYAYLVSLLIDNAAVATLATARLFVMPVMLLLTAWGRIFLPRAGTLIASDAKLEVRRLATRGALVLVAVSVPYLAAVGVFFWLGGMHYLSAKYQGVGPYVALWAVFAIVAIVRSAASNALLAHHAFRDLFTYAVVAAIVSLALVTALTPAVGVSGAVTGLVAGEVILVALAWRRLLQVG